MMRFGSKTIPTRLSEWYNPFQWISTQKSLKGRQPHHLQVASGFPQKKKSTFQHLFLFYLSAYSFIFIKKASWSYQSCSGETFSHNSSLLFKIILENSTFISVHYFIFSFPISDRKMLWLSIHASVFDVWFFPLFNTNICVNLFLFQNFDCRIATFTTFLPSEWIEQNISG